MPARPTREQIEDALRRGEMIVRLEQGGHAAGMGFVCYFAEPLDDGGDGRLPVLVRRDRAPVDAKVPSPQSFRNGAVGPRRLQLLPSFALVEGVHSHAGVDADDLDAAVVEAPPSLADRCLRELFQLRQVHLAAKETNLHAGEVVGLRECNDLVDVVVGTPQGAESEFEHGAYPSRYFFANKASICVAIASAACCGVICPTRIFCASVMITV